MDKFDRLLSSTIVDLLNYNCEVEFVQSDKIQFSDNNILKYSCGYFDDSLPKICVAVKKDKEDWFGTYIHEYCHFLQWLEKDQIYIDHNNAPHIEKFDDWISQEKPLSKRELPHFKTCAKITQQMELSNERRVVDLLNRWNFPKKFINSYIQKANAYIFFYEIIKKYKMWYDFAPFEIPEIYSTLDVKLYNDYSNMPEDLEKLMLQCCFKPTYR